MPRRAGALGDAVPVTHTAGKQKPRRWPVGLAWALWAVTVLSLPVVVWLYQLLRQAGLSELGIPVAANLPLLVAVVSAATVGAVLASRRPAHPVGWLLLAAGLSEQCTNLVGEYVHYGVMGRPGGLPAASYQGESRLLDSPEDVCPGQARFEYPATSVPFSTCPGSTTAAPS
jgi:hypothetical protein